MFLELPLTELAEWIRTIPNEGLIRYYMVGNLERVFLTSPKALSDVLVHKAYDFAKPELVQLQLRRLTGNGVLLAEGHDHKVRQHLAGLFGYGYVLTVRKATTQESHASVLLSSYQRPVPSILD